MGQSAETRELVTVSGRRASLAQFQGSRSSSPGSECRRLVPPGWRLAPAEWRPVRENHRAEPARRPAEPWAVQEPFREMVDPVPRARLGSRRPPSFPGRAAFRRSSPRWSPARSRLTPARERV